MENRGRMEGREGVEKKFSGPAAILPPGGDFFAVPPLAGLCPVRAKKGLPVLAGPFLGGLPEGTSCRQFSLLPSAPPHRGLPCRPSVRPTLPSALCFEGARQKSRKKPAGRMRQASEFPGKAIFWGPGVCEAPQAYTLK